MSEERLIVNKKKLGSKRLGMGLSALLGGIEDVDIFNNNLSKVQESLDYNTPSTTGFNMITIEKLKPNQNQPRKIFNEAELKELSNSISQNGILQPILVRKIEESTFQIIAGERRYRAAKLAGLKEIPCIVKELSDEEVFVLGIIENVQREELNPIEEAESYSKLMKDYCYTQERVAEIIGRSRSYIANITRLSGLPEKLKQLVIEGKLTAGHVRPLLSLTSEEQMIEVADVIISNSYSVRKVEELISLILEDSQKTLPELILPEAVKKVGSKVNKQEEVHQFISQIAKAFHERFDLPVKIRPSKKGGIISIKYKNEKELQKVMDELVKNKEESLQFSTEPSEQTAKNENILNIA